MNRSPGAGWRPASLWTFGLGVPALAVVCFFMASGCSGCNQDVKPGSTAKGDKDLLSQAREQYRSSDEAGKYRQANQLLNKYLAAHADVVAKFQPGTKTRPALEALLATHAKSEGKKLDDRALYRKFLESVAGLDTGEVEEVEADTFRLLDAHYLAGCHAMRAVTRGMPLENLTPLERAEFCFHWVTRYVALDETRDELLPPQFVLERGLGSSRERLFLLAALLQQLNIDTVAIAVPGTDGTARPWLAGVLVADNASTDIYLFDFRLGMAVPGPEGKGIVTLKQLQANPKLLEAFNVPGATYDVTAKQVEKLEIWLLAPLSGLSARMRYLEEEVLFDFDRINLAVKLPELMDKCDQLKAGPVRVWNAPAGKSGSGPQSPTRSLRQFLPPDEGGVDKTQERYQKFRASLYPLLAFRQGLVELKVGPAELPGKEAQQQLEDLCKQVWTNYLLAPEEYLLRGRLDDSANRVVRLQAALRDIEGLQLNADFQQRVIAWRERLKQALADPGKAAEAWNDDQWLWRFVRNPDENLAEDRRLEKGVLSQVILGAVARSAEPQSDRLLALRWHEAAERLGWQNKQLPGGPGKPERDRVKQAWSNAQTYWSNYGQRNSASLGGLPGKLAGLPKLAQTSAAPAEALLASYAWLAKQSAAAQLLQAEALSHAGQKLQAEAALNKLLADVDGLKAVDWGPIRTAVGDKNRGSFDETRSDFDVDRGGTAEWTRHAALLRLAALKRPQS